MTSLELLRSAIMLVPVLIGAFSVFQSEMRKFEDLYGQKCQLPLLLGQFFKYQTHINRYDPYQRTAITIIFAMFPYFLVSVGIGVVSSYLF